MENITYTIIIPHHNTPNLLQRCLDSIPQRDDLEIIIIDDNSSPDKVDFRHFPGQNRKNVYCIFDKKGKGAGAARNIGLKYAKGKWLLFADADDYYANGFLDILDKHLNNDTDILYYNVFSDSTNEITNRATTINKIYNDYFMAKSPNINIIKYGTWAPWNKVISHKLVKYNNIKFEEIPVGNDAFFSLYAGKIAQKVKVINDQLYCITYQEGSITYSPATYERELLYLDIKTRINQFHRENNCLPREYRLVLINWTYLKRLYKYYGIKKATYCIKYIIKHSSPFDIPYNLVIKKFIRIKKFLLQQS